MNKGVKIILVVAAVALVGVSFAIPAWQGHLGGDEHKWEALSGEHWSILLQVFPGMVQNVHSLIQDHPTYIGHEEPNRVSHMFMAALVTVILIALGFAVRSRLKRETPMVPDAKLTPLSLLEVISEAVLSLMEGVMGRENAIRYFPLIGTLALFILTSNLLGMIPGFVPPTDSLNTTLALGVVVFLATHFYGFKSHGPAYLKHFLGPVIKWYALPLMLLMFVIEMISHLVRPCSLAMRLMGNIMGDHKVLFIFLGFGILLVPLPIMALGLIVAIVQTLVFSLLSIVYIGLAVEHEEGHH